MAHLSENTKPLKEKHFPIELKKAAPSCDAIEFIILPNYKNLESIPANYNLNEQLNGFLERTENNSTIAVLTSSIFAAEFCANITNKVRLQLWVTVKLQKPFTEEYGLSQQHAALLIFTRYTESLNHTKTRIGYTYCPTCNRTTKDYGGKKHLYHEFGTLMSDVWRDITVDFDDFPTSVLERLKDLFGLPEYTTINIYDQRFFFPEVKKSHQYFSFNQKENQYSEKSILLNGDCIEILKTIPDNSIDFCFADPPYNLKKKYESWNDGITIQKYFEWCDEWLSELARVLKPGRTLAVLNIPQWCVRHFKYLNTILDYQDWIAWEGLSMPVRMIMPAHYSILCFSKGKPRHLPCIARGENTYIEKKAITTFSENFCLRSNCIKKRNLLKIQDMEITSNIWWDIHRLKHNSRRVDHPCQLPPMFMYRLISMFTNENEFVLDPFNGAGTTSLSARQMDRKYVGIELSEYYFNITTERHKELSLGLDPFRKNNNDKPKAKNSPVERLKKQKYEVSKKLLQLEVKQIATILGKIPSKEDVIKMSKYPIEYYENYFISWGEVTAAARTTGMTEYKADETTKEKYRITEDQLKLFEGKKKMYKGI